MSNGNNKIFYEEIPLEFGDELREEVSSLSKSIRLAFETSL